MTSKNTTPLWALACVLVVAVLTPGCCDKETFYESIPYVTSIRGPSPTPYLTDSTRAGFVQLSPSGTHALLSQRNQLTIASEGNVVEELYLPEYDLEQGGACFSQCAEESFSYSNTRFSPTSPEIALSLQVDTTYDNVENIYTYDWKRDDFQKLTDLPSGMRATHPVYSPDGTHLAYVVRADSMTPRLQIRPLGQQPDTTRTLTTIDVPLSSSPFAFSPDGSHVVHSKFGFLKMTALETGTTRALTRRPVYPAHVTFSADGSRIAFLSKPRNGPESIYVLNPTTGEKRQIAPYGGLDPTAIEFHNVHFVSDENTLVYARRRTDPTAKFQVYRFDLPQGTSDRIAEGSSPRIPGNLSRSILAASSSRDAVLYVSESSHKSRVCPRI